MLNLFILVQIKLAIISEGHIYSIKVGKKRLENLAKLKFLERQYQIKIASTNKDQMKFEGR